MLIAVIVLVWIAALVPMVLRRLSERQAVTSVDQFRHRTWLFRRAYPLMNAPASPLVPSPQVHRTGHDDLLHQERSRRRRRRERRRRVLVGFGVTIASSLVLGAIPALRGLWDLTIVSVILGSCYIGVLTNVARNEALSLERRRKVVQLPTRSLPTHQARSQTFAAAGGGRGGSASVTPMPRHPAFVLVDAPRS